MNNLKKNNFGKLVACNPLDGKLGTCKKCKTSEVCLDKGYCEDCFFKIKNKK